MACPTWGRAEDDGSDGRVRGPTDKKGENSQVNLSTMMFSPIYNLKCGLILLHVNLQSTVATRTFVYCKSPLSPLIRLYTV